MSRRVINPNQLSMFMRPGEIKATTFPGDYDIYGDGPGEKGINRMWSEKERNNWMNDTDVDVEAHGVEEPVTVVHGPEGAKFAGSPHQARRSGKPVLADGHHRVQAADAAERNKKREYYVPVQHSETSPWGPNPDRGDEMRNAAANWFQNPIES